jgi:hypothetical protein
VVREAAGGTLKKNNPNIRGTAWNEMYTVDCLWVLNSIPLGTMVVPCLEETII